MQQAEHVVLFEPVPSMEKIELDGESKTDDSGPELPNQFHRGFHRSASSQKIVNDQNILPRLDGVEVNFECIGSIFQVVGYAGSRRGQFVRLAHRYESGVQAIG